MNYPNAEQLEALKRFAKTAGRRWKQALRDAWMNGGYDATTGEYIDGPLQQVRNSFGPSWLTRFKIPDEQCKLADFPGDRGKPAVDTLETIDLCNGEVAMLQEVAHFLEFLRAESVSTPIPMEELNHLLTRYVKHVRREQMAYVSELRVSRGESPLPKAVLA